MSRSISFSGTVLVTDPETGEEVTVEYEGVYEPACSRGHIDDWTPDNSWIELVSYPEEWEDTPFLKQVKEMAWKDFNNSSGGY